MTNKERLEAMHHLDAVIEMGWIDTNKDNNDFQVLVEALELYKEKLNDDVIRALKESKFKVGERVSHVKYGDGKILGNYHKRPDGRYYWHVGYDDGTFGYAKECSLIKL